MLSTSITLGAMERDAASYNVTVSSLALDREYPTTLVALAAALDVAVRMEGTARMYDIETLREKAREIRTGVDILAHLLDPKD